MVVSPSGTNWTFAAHNPLTRTELDDLASSLADVELVYSR